MLESNRELYEPLCDWQTCLIELLPASRDEPLCCSLHVADSITLPGLALTHQRRRIEYEAISYSWGHPDRTATILCNGVLTYIPPNLAEALQALRSESKPRWLWCDALSIDQDNQAEKSAQVRMMLTIFFKASGVVAWLGPFNEHTAHDFSILAPGRSDIAEVRDSISRLTKYQWFSRTWVRQEVFAARHLTLQCGSDLLDSDTFLRLARDGISLPPLLEPVYGRAIEPPKLDSLSENLTTEFIGVLRAGAHFGATDPRDRVYALLGMVNGLDRSMDLPKPSSIGTASHSPQRRPFPVDYTRSVSQVYQDVIRYLMNETGILDCLNYLGSRGRRRDLPSWTLDWSDAHDCERFYRHWGVSASIPGKYQYRLATSQKSIVDGDLHLQGQVLGLVGKRHPGQLGHSFLTIDKEVNPDFCKLLSSREYACVDLEERHTHASLGRIVAGIAVPSTAEEGDTIALLDGNPLAFILRPLHASNRSRLVGAAWFWAGQGWYTQHTFSFPWWAFKIAEAVKNKEENYLQAVGRLSILLERIEQRRKVGHEDEQVETFFLV